MPTKEEIAQIKEDCHPSWCGSVDWAPACKLKGHQFDSQSGHMPGLRARSPVGGLQEATMHHTLMFLSLSFSLLSPLSKKVNKIFFKKDCCHTSAKILRSISFESSIFIKKKSWKKNQDSLFLVQGLLLWNCNTRKPPKNQILLRQKWPWWLRSYAH